MDNTELTREIASKDISIDGKSFYLSVLIELDKLMEDVIGTEECRGFVGMVADKIGQLFQQQYRQALPDMVMSPLNIAHVLVDLKRRIGGDFSLLSVTPDKIVLHNKRCPFGDAVIQHRSLCAMTANVFGNITSDAMGYAGVELEKTIANGDGHCHIIVHLKPDNVDHESAYEYFSG